jgi:4'-phosphopantetheinyl transferase
VDGDRPTHGQKVLQTRSPGSNPFPNPIPGSVGVQLWSFDLDADLIGAPSGEAFARDELERAGRFRFGRDRRRYLAGRARLRALLGSYVGEEPGRLHFSYGRHGKPALDNDRSVRFNLTHCGSRAVLALARGCEIGVDIELVRPDFAEENIAEHFFSMTEVSWLRHLPPDQQRQAFFECWTRKESFLKAKGGGLSIPLHAFDVAFGPGRTAELLRSDLDPTDTERWRIIDISDDVPGYVAAVAVDSGGRPVTIQIYGESDQAGVGDTMVTGR